ncbi:MAG: hypothetical protein MR291_08370, partial [Oscillospiraceae bacterium]|nr:hypothetical protein [Oscillospiraceae bacterium]
SLYSGENIPEVIFYHTVSDSVYDVIPLDFEPFQLESYLVQFIVDIGIRVFPADAENGTRYA